MLSVADTAAELAEHAALHDAHGYSQPNRAAVGTGATAGEWVTVSDGRTYGIATGDYDCSSMGVQCYAAQGVDCGGAWSTHDMEQKMVASGNFVSLPRDTWRNPKRGDLLLAPGKHVAVALGGGRVAEAVRSENHSTHGQRGDQDGGEIVIRGLYDDGWTCVLRYCGPEREEPEPEEPAARGASVQLYDGNATDAQRWAVSWDAEGYVTLTAMSCGLALDVMNGGAASGNPVWAYTPNGTDSQKWSVHQKGGNYNPADSAPVELAPKVNEDLRLDCVGGGTANGTGIQTYDANGTSAQEWSILDHGDGTWTLINVGSSQALDVVGGGN